MKIPNSEASQTTLMFRFRERPGPKLDKRVRQNQKREEKAARREARRKNAPAE